MGADGMAEAGTARSYDAPALVGAGTGVAGAVLAMTGQPTLGFGAAVIALVLSLVSRRRLRADPTVRGSRASLLAFLLGAIVLLAIAIPLALSVILPTLFLITHPA